MKKLFTILAVVTTIMTIVSCQPNDNKEIRKAFKEYVKTDFDNPNDFVEIAKIQVYDTISKESMIKMAEVIAMYADTVKYESVANDAREYINKFKDDKTFIVIYKLNIRLKNNKESHIKEYYAIDNKGIMSIKDHLIKKDEMPKLYRDFSEDCNTMIMKLDLFVSLFNH